MFQKAGCDSVKKGLPIGVSDFIDIIEENLYLVDKSLMVKDLLEDGSKVILLTRPRRFGKTLNISMIKNFFQKTEEDRGYLFKNLKIWKYENATKHFGKYPVIYITFKDLKDNNFEKMYEKLKEIVSIEYGKHGYLVSSGILNQAEIMYYNDILLKKASEAQYETSLKNLSEYLCRYHKQKVMILVDEYDVPIQSGYLNNFYEQVIEFIRNFLSGGLKDNENLYKAVLTGILRIAKESIFSGLNNLNAYTILNTKYSEYFGFTEREVEEILTYYGIEAKMKDVKSWYNGYIFGEEVIYNPWSILKYIDNYKTSFQPYWVNTSSNDLVKKLLTKGGEKVKEELESLIKGENLVKTVNQDIVMHEIDNGTENVWSFMLFSGYLKTVSKEITEGEFICNLAIPNLEVRYLYKQIILGWFKESITNDKFTFMLESLINGDIESFEDILSEFVYKSVSYFDTEEKNESFYHALVLGMLTGLGETYEVKSNRESGYGRYDVMVIPKDKSRLGIVMEFKKVNKRKKETLEIAIESALKQLKDKDYKEELLSRGIKNILQIGIAFDGKDLLIKRME